MKTIEEKRKELLNDIEKVGVTISAYPCDYKDVEEAKLEGFDEGVKATRKEIIQREIKMLCLSCGKTSLRQEIVSKKIFIHLCGDCRLKYLEEFKK